ncbi:MAG TPA: zeta toxin family protein [Terriglobia bacterium]|nr:zeta toxin family protein [Terriglobia bacterium]
MIVIAGPPGSGKSSVFPVSEAGVDFFNIDDQAALLNGGSYQSIPPEIRAQASRECEQFITTHIADGRSFAVETTLRTRKALEQAEDAREHGFETEMIYVALDYIGDNIERIAIRADAGGHAASPGRIRAIHRASLGNLPAALRQFDRVWVYDNSAPGGPRRLVMETCKGSVRFVADEPPRWLREAFRGTEYGSF